MSRDEAPTPNEGPSTGATASVDLAAFIDEVTGGPADGVEERLGEGFVRLDVAEAERRQAIHDVRWVEDALIELLRNARDAHARSIYIATTKNGDERSLVVVDDGSGIPEDMQELVFEARVTSKLETMSQDEWGVHGRGMALYSIRERSDRSAVVWSRPGLGTSLAADFDVATIPERADQSSWPTLVSAGKGEEGDTLRGPRNLIRTCCAFALTQPFGPKVYIGSPSHIVATLRHAAKATHREAELIFETDYDRLPIAQQLLAAPDAATLAERSTKIGLPLSERTAHRVLSGAIRPVRSVMERLKHSSSPRSSEGVDLLRDRRHFKLSEADTLELKSRLLSALDPIAERYFLRVLESPTVRQTPGALHVTYRISLDEEG